jgi:hypothetical protein
MVLHVLPDTRARLTATQAALLLDAVAGAPSRERAQRLRDAGATQA